jgi:CheY-like chemotaxis protein
MNGTEHARPGPARLQVLVVEDNLDAAQTTAQLVRLGGHDARVAGDGPSALQALYQGQPDVVLLDLGLPGMDGFEVARRMRELSRDKDPFFIAITGHGQERDRRRSHEAGIDLHLLKPVDPRTLQDLLKRFARVVLPPR